jgi:multiple sugar transport system permease protein
MSTQETPVRSLTAVPDIRPASQATFAKRFLNRKALGIALTYFFGISLSLWILVPILFIASMALTTPATVRAYPKGVMPFIPFSADTLSFFLRSRGVIPGILNSVLVAAITLVLSTVIAAPAGYALARFFFPGRSLFRLSILGVRALPVVILAIPLAVFFIDLGIYDTLLALAFVHTALALPTAILILASVFASIPYDIEEAAQIDGCGTFETFRFILLPLVMSWNEVFAASILTIQNRTLPAQVLAALPLSSEPYQFAGGFFMLVPSLIFIFFIRNYLFNMWGQASK